MKGLAPHTEQLFERIATLECIKPFVLVGGTALSLQLGTRLSEDLDFMKWRTSKNERMEVNWPVIKQELESIGTLEDMNLMDLDHVEFIVDGVKLSFYAAGRYAPPMRTIPLLHNLRIADIKSIGAMKMEVLLRRANFRDYYDIYSVLQAGENLQEMMQMALSHSGHRLKSKQLIALLTNGARFNRDSHFEQLSPLYSVSALEIEEYMKSLLK
ncbi:MAG: nucleotidyl transferase AbiEii/AbiGii toxin family protein [Bacteroidaceae bacterium]|nr:nucleotidyl transferase AbiEii/AbiGii toxin family protein [Bacteroidaceae bacterium]